MDTVVRPTGLRSYEHHDRKTTRMTHETPLVERVSFRDSDHTYYLDGKRIPSVTTLLGNLSKPGLIYWAANIGADAVAERVRNLTPGDLAQLEMAHEDSAWLDPLANELHRLAKRAHIDRKNNAAAKGNQVHDAIDRFQTDYFNAEPPDEPNALASYEAFLRWWKESDFSYIDGERKIVDAQGRYSGRLDLLCENDNGLFVCDVKTSAGVYPEHVLQNAGYAAAIESELEREVAGTIVLWIPEGAAKLIAIERDREEWQRDFRIFESLIALHAHRKALDKWLTDIKKTHTETLEEA